MGIAGLPPAGDPFGDQPPPSHPFGDQPPPDDPWALPSPPGFALEPAGYGSRAGAAAIDLLVRLGILLACIAAGALLFLVDESTGEIGLVCGIGLGAILTWFVYAPVMLARTDGQTVGHRVTGTRVVMADGSRMSGGRGFVREALVKNVLVETIGSFTLYVLPLLNYLWPLWDPENKALHDMMCGTRVVASRR